MATGHVVLLPALWAKWRARQVQLIFLAVSRPGCGFGFTTDFLFDFPSPDFACASPTRRLCCRHRLVVLPNQGGHMWAPCVAAAIATPIHSATRGLGSENHAELGASSARGGFRFQEAWSGFPPDETGSSGARYTAGRQGPANMLFSGVRQEVTESTRRCNPRWGPECCGSHLVDDGVASAVCFS